MKKITLLVLSIFASATMSSQIVLSHSTDNTVYESGSVACTTNPDQVPQSGDEGSSDNVFYRAYTPADFNATGNFDIEGARFFISFLDVSGSNETSTFTVRFFTSSDVFPAGTLTEIASKSVQATSADDEQLFEVYLDTPVTVDSNDEVIVAVDFPAASAVPNNYDIRIGMNELGENDPSYLSSAGCGITDPTATAGIGFPDNHIILDILGDGTLSVDNQLLSQVSIYPVPATDVINIKTPSNIQVTGATLYDLLGKNTGVVYSNGQVDVSALSRGVYMLTVETNEGSLTQKIVKK